MTRNETLTDGHSERAESQRIHTHSEKRQKRYVAIIEWRKTLHSMIRQRRFSNEAIETSLKIDDPAEFLSRIFPEDVQAIEAIRTIDPDCLRNAVARYQIIRRLQSKPEWPASSFTEALCLTTERIRQLRRRPLTRFADLGISPSRPGKARIIPWQKPERPKGLDRLLKKKQTRNKSLRDRLRSLIIKVAQSRIEKGFSTYHINMLIGNSDLPSRNIEWLIIELAEDQKIECMAWLDGRRKLYRAVNGSDNQENEISEICGLDEFLAWVDEQPRKKRNTGIPDEAPDVTLLIRGKKVSSRQWVGMPEEASRKEGEDLAKIYRQKR